MQSRYKKKLAKVKKRPAREGHGHDEICSYLAGRKFIGRDI